MKKTPIPSAYSQYMPAFPALIGGGLWWKGMFGLFLVMIICFFGSFTPMKVQRETDYAVHANIIFHFTKYINWPAHKRYGTFVIGVTGVTPLYDELTKRIAGRWTGGQKIVIKKYSASATSFQCHILFVSDDESSSLKKIADRTAGASILIVSESKGLAKKGSCINFVVVDDHLKLEINKNNIDDRDLGIASELLQLGKIVK